MFTQKRSIIPKSQDFSAWYNDVVLQAELADYAPVKGCMVIRPNGYAIWERVQKEFDRMIKAHGVQNAYFPLFIPESFLNKEKEHVEGFSPELAVVTIGGGEELKEKLIVRPTSETVMYAMYAKWIKSHRDLPLLINQWNNVVRWEKRTYLFLRTTEFLWQEGHTAHKSEADALDFAQTALSLYKKLYEEYYGMYGIVGEKSNQEKFAGAKKTWSIEFLMPDGKALQGCTSHNLGDNFAKAFDIKYQDEGGQSQYVWQTSWGLSTRSIGGLIMVHGDDQGLVLPPKLAPTQVVIVPITSPRHPERPEGVEGSLSKYVDKIYQELEEADIRVHIDDRETHSPGWKFNEWEIKGVPVRLEIGEKEIQANTVTIYRRDENTKTHFPLSTFSQTIKGLLDEIQLNLFTKSKQYVEEHTYDVDSYDEFKEIMKTKKGFIRAFWCEDPICEAKIKEETKASTRVKPLDAKEETGSCIYCKKQSHARWYFGQAY